MLFDFDIPDEIEEELFDTKNNTHEKYICTITVGYSNRPYRVYISTELEDKTEVGFTNYQGARIYIKYLDMNMVTKTLIHELTHVWMYENGHNQADKEFNNEDVCEICACSYEFIYDSLQQFYESLLMNTIKTEQGKH